MHTLPEPSQAPSDVGELVTTYLDFYRAEVERKVLGLDDTLLRSAVLASGWSLAELVEHLVHMERRWFVWGFLGEPVTDPWGDQDDEGRWSTTRPLTQLLEELHSNGRRTTQIIADHSLTTRAATGGRFTEDPPTLLAICLHVLQEYARHAGHADVVRELSDGSTGEDPAAS